MKNLEIKTKKMSLANMENKLTLEEMENVMAGAGSNCKLGMRLATVFVGGAFALATAGIGSFVVGGLFGMGGAYLEDRVCR